MQKLADPTAMHPVPALWACDHCAAANRKGDDYCTRCGRSRVRYAPAAIATFCGVLVAAMGIWGAFIIWFWTVTGLFP